MDSIRTAVPPLSRRIDGVDHDASQEWLVSLPCDLSVAVDATVWPAIERQLPGELPVGLVKPSFKMALLEQWFLLRASAAAAIDFDYYNRWLTMARTPVADGADARVMLTD